MIHVDAKPPDSESIELLHEKASTSTTESKTTTYVYVLIFVSRIFQMIIFNRFLLQIVLFKRGVKIHALIIRQL